MRALAVDLGGAKTAIAVIDEEGCIVEKRKMPAAQSFEETVRQIASACDASVDAAGVIVPGIYETSTGNAWAPNLWGRDFYPLRSALEQTLSVPAAFRQRLRCVVC